MGQLEALLTKNMIEGIYAQRKLNGDPDIIAKDDPEFLKFVIRQGNRSEERLLQMGKEWLVEKAKERARGKTE